MTEWEREEKWVKAFGRMNYYACTECCQCLLIIPIGELYLRWGGWIEFIGAWGRRRECWIYIIFYEPAIESNRRTTGLVPYFHVQPINIWGFRERPHSISSFSSLIWHCPLKSKSFPSIKWYWLGLGFPRTHFSFFSVWCESVVFFGFAAATAADDGWGCYKRPSIPCAIHKHKLYWMKYLYFMLCT